MNASPVPARAWRDAYFKASNRLFTICKFLEKGAINESDAAYLAAAIKDTQKLCEGILIQSRGSSNTH